MHGEMPIKVLMDLDACSGIAATLAPGQYTALLAGLNSGTGLGLVEVYDLGAL